MINIKRAEDRGQTNIGWLNSHHSFSFGDYYDSENKRFGPLRVINDDRVKPGAGFGTHGHRDMEILTYVLGGALQHKDSMGSGSVIRHGDVQRMSAGTGVRHSEFNASKTDPVHFLQIWIMPESVGMEPSYEEIRIPDADKRGRLRLIGSRDGRDGSVTIHQNVDLYAGLFDGDETAQFNVESGRSVWLQVALGSLSVSGQMLKAGDSLSLTGQSVVELTRGKNAEVLLFDLSLGIGEAES